MSEEDPRIATMRHQLGRLNTLMARANADYQEAQQCGDNDAAAQAAQEYADADQARVNLLNTAQRIAYSEQAAAPRQLTREEVNNMPLENMSPEVRKWWFAQQSKHGQDSAAYDAGERHVRENPVRR